MTDEHKLLRDQDRALHAQSLLENDMLQEAFRTLEDSYTAAWRNSHIDDAAAREKLFLAINIVGKIKDHLAVALRDGKLAAAELKEIADTAERRKRFGTV
jgi:hypothetical protein